MLSACAGTVPDKTRTPNGTSAPAPTDGPTSGPDSFDPLEGTDPALAEYYGQQVSWDECGADTRCADVIVPLDYETPDDGRTVRLAVTIKMSAGDGAPALFLNPGGPGGSGVDMVDWIGFAFTDTLMSSYNPIGFDPRGVNHSDAVMCLTDAEWDERNDTIWDTSTDEGLQQYVSDTADFVASCEENTGELLGYLDTVSAAKDLDILRAVVGQKATLDYLGFSYGTFLGATYAELFPERVGAFVLDAAVDPALELREISLGQAAGFENSIREYMADCQAGPGCPFDGDVESGLEQLSTFFDVLAATPLPTDDPDRALTAPLAVTVILTMLYQPEISPEINRALDAGMNQNDGTALLYWADVVNGRLEDGTYEDNSSDAFLAINCLDYPVQGTLDDWKADAQAMIDEISPFWEDALAYTEVTCSQWPYPASGAPGPLTAAGSAPILVVGTTGDPATPYEWSVALAEQLENGRLLTYDGMGHTAYGRSNACVHDAVDAFLIDGVLPAEGTTC